MSKQKAIIKDHVFVLSRTTADVWVCTQCNLVQVDVIQEATFTECIKDGKAKIREGM